MDDSADGWLDSLAAAWRAERQAVRSKLVLERSGRSLAERVSLGTALSHLRIVDEQGAPGDRWRVQVAVPDAIDLDSVRLGPGDPIRLWAQRGAIELADAERGVRGVVERREDQTLWLMVDPTASPFGDAAGGGRASTGVHPLDEIDRDWALDPEAPEVTFDRGDAAIANARDARAGTDLARTRDVVAGVRPPRPIAAVSWTPIDTALDDAQRAAIDGALRSGDVALIHGPPGTGKTRTLVEVVRQRARRGERVLCAAPSNTAVDNLGARLATTGLRVVRLGHPARVSSALAELTIDAQVESGGATELARDWRDRARALRKSAMAKKGAAARELWAEARALDRDAYAEVGKAQRAIVERAEVVLVTLVGAASSLLGDDRFDCVVVDEATQAPDPLLLVALARGRVAVLAGDPHQLGPVVTGGPEVARTLASTSFDRIAASEPAPMLVVQHRMHAQIMEFPSRATYDGRLVAAPEVAAHRLEDLGVAPDPERDQPLWLVDTAGKDWLEERTELDPGSSMNGAPAFAFDPSTFNRGNAERVAAEARRLLSRGLPPADLAIIAAYSAQARRLRELLRVERAAGLEIGTVDGFQGREKEAVIVDLVRSNDHGELGFLANTRRMNVALTRARRQLLVIADSATLGGHPYYAAFVDYADSIAAHGSAWSDDAAPLA